VNLPKRKVDVVRGGLTDRAQATACSLWSHDPTQTVARVRSRRTGTAVPRVALRECTAFLLIARTSGLSDTAGALRLAHTSFHGYYYERCPESLATCANLSMMNVRSPVEASLNQALTVAELLADDVTDGAELIAGNAGLHRPISAVNVMTAPDIGPWVRQHEFLLVTATRCRAATRIKCNSCMTLTTWGWPGWASSSTGTCLI